MGPIQDILFILVIIAILMVVPSLIATLTTKTILKDKSKSVRIAGFIVALIVSLVLEAVALSAVAPIGFPR